MSKIDFKYDIDEEVMAYLDVDLWGNEIGKKIKGKIASCRFETPMKVTPMPKKKDMFYYIAIGGKFYLVLFLHKTLKGQQQQEVWLHEDQISKIKKVR